MSRRTACLDGLRGRAGSCKRAKERQGLKPVDFRGLSGTIEEATEKLRIPCDFGENRPSAAQADFMNESLTAQLKPRPFKTVAWIEFFRNVNESLTAQLKPRPFKTVAWMGAPKTCRIGVGAPKTSRIGVNIHKRFQILGIQVPDWRGFERSGRIVCDLGHSGLYT